MMPLLFPAFFNYYYHHQPHPIAPLLRTNRRTIIAKASPHNNKDNNQSTMAITTEVELLKQILLLRNYPGMIPRIIIKRLRAGLA
jgi:hypothetical protein